jgi:hypothetical protein
MANIDFSKIFTLKYWIEGTTAGADVNIVPVANGSFFYYFYLTLFCGFLILGILVFIYKIFLNKEHPAQPKFGFLGQNLIWQGILGLGWFFCRQVNVSFFSARLWLIFGFFWVAYILFWFIRYRVQFYPLEQQYYLNQLKGQKSKK